MFGGVFFAVLGVLRECFGGFRSVRGSVVEVLGVLGGVLWRF